MSDLILTDVRKSYGAVEIIKGVNLTVEPGEFVVLVGPSGCGKSTLLRMIAGLETITSGSLEIGGQRVNETDPSKRGIAMVFQSYALYPHMTVRENMGFALSYTGVSKAEIERQVLEGARILELEPLLDRKPAQLSGGQRQRVAIGRAIVRHPKVFLFDEPLSNLDAELRVHMRIEIAKLHKQLATTMVYVTHDQVEAMTLADKIVVLRAGKVEQVGSPLDLYNNPANAFVAGFIGSPKMNFIKAELTGDPPTICFAGVSAPAPIAARGLQAGAPLTLGIRPEHFDRDALPDVVLDVAIDVVEQLGGTSFVHGHLATGERIVIERRDSSGAKGGWALKAGLKLADTRLFDAEGARIK